MPGSLDDLQFIAYPPAIDISTPANPQVFNPQFGVANNSKTETISLARALLLVPVTTNGTNLAQNTDMVPKAITSGWTFSRASAPPNDQGYAAFALLPDDGVGDIAPRGSVAFILAGVTVNTDAGTAVLQLEAKTSDGLWTPTYGIELTTPSTIPHITRYSIMPADPQAQTTLQGQAVAVTWTTSGAAYCVIEDDQLNKWDNQPTSGMIAPTPSVGNSPVEHDAQGGRYYTRTFTLTAYAAGAMDSDQRPAPTAIQLPTISNFSMTPASLAIGQQVTATWSVANIDPNLGAITLTLDPADGTGPYAIAIPPTQTSGSGVVTPTPQTTTTYTLSVDNGYGATFSSPEQQVISSLNPGWQEMHGLETLSVRPGWGGPVNALGLVVFANCLWCWTSDPPGLFRTADGASWTAVTPTPSLPPLDGLVVADLGDGEKLWAFGGAPFLASSNDGVNWETLPAPAYPGRSFGNYLVGDGTILVLGGRAGGNSNPSPITDVWSTSDGRTWTHVGNSFPTESLIGFAGHSVACFAETLQTVANDSSGVLWGYSSSDGGKTWVRQTTAISRTPNVIPGLLPVGDGLLLFAIALSNMTPDAMVMDSTGAWSVSTDFSPPGGDPVWSAAIYNDCLWLATAGAQNAMLGFFLLNRLLSGTTFTLTPPPTTHRKRESARREQTAREEK